MELSKFKIEGPLLFQRVHHEDDRGFFTELYQSDKYSTFAVPDFVQDNLSRSSKGVFRGLHWQIPPHGQGKLVTCLSGEIVDFIVDIRSGSQTFMEYLAIPLSGECAQSLWVPEGFAHGFLSLRDETLVHYKVTGLWNKSSERSLSPKILKLEDWLNGQEPTLSKKDLGAPEILQETYPA